MTLPDRPRPLCRGIQLLPRDVPLIITLSTRLGQMRQISTADTLTKLPFIGTTGTKRHRTSYLFNHLPIKPIAALATTLPCTTRKIPVPGSNSHPSRDDCNLFTPGHALIPNAVLPGSRTIGATVAHLAPALQSVLTLGLLHLARGQTTSKLKIAITLRSVHPGTGTLLHRRARHDNPGDLLPTNRMSNASAITLIHSAHFLCHIAGQNSRPLCVLIVHFSDRNSYSTQIIFPRRSPISTILTSLPPTLTPHRARIVPGAPGN